METVRKNVEQEFTNIMESVCTKIMSKNFAKQLEHEVYHVSQGVDSRYRWKVREMLYNLEKNALYLLWTYPVCVLPYVTSEMLANGTKATETVEKNLRRMKETQRILREGLEYKTSDDPSTGLSLRCRHCHSANVAWQSRQLRRADEPATIFCTCLTCDTRWRMG